MVENGRLTPTEEGTPQGGVVSLALLNVALHGMEHAAGVRYQRAGNGAAAAAKDSPVLIRYADLCRARHKSAYAEHRIMPTRLPGALVRGGLAVLWSA